MKIPEQLLMEFIAKYASHWINAEDDFPKDLNAIIDAIQLTQPLPTEDELNNIIQPHAISLEHGEKAVKEIIEYLKGE